MEPEIQRDKDPLSQLKSNVRKARIDAVWEQLNAKDAANFSKPVMRHQSTSRNQAQPKKTSPPEWMVSLGLAPKKSMTFTNREEEEVEKDGVKEDTRKIAAAALAAVREASMASKEGKIEVTEVRDFAGEEVKITKYVDSASKSAQVLKRREEVLSSSSSGLDKLLQQIEKKPKLNVLDKSKKDWGEFKEEKGLEVELEAYKKSGDKYLDKVAFLQRADIREYEKERDIRLALQAKRRTDVSFAE